MVPEVVYQPPVALETNIDILRKRISERHRVDLKDYHQLHDFSTQRANEFWMFLWEFLEIRASVQPTRAIDESARIDQFPVFFEDARLNYAENMLARDDADIAIKYISESNQDVPVEVTWIGLREMVREFADAMRASSIAKHDVVCIIGGNSPTSLALFLATASIGALVSTFAPDAGERILTSKLGQLRPKLVFADAQYQYNGKRHDCAARINNVFTAVDKPQGAEITCTSGDSTPAGWVAFDEFKARGTGRPLAFEQVPFSHPLLVAFTSGTTGTPKGIVHSHGGTTINGKKESRLHKNFGPNDVQYHYANIGWVLWNIMISALSCGTTLVLYDGSPFYPTPERQLGSVFRAGVTAWGAGPRYFSELEKARVNPAPYVKNLKCILTAGAILTEAQSKWLRNAFGPVCQMSFSGGTELCGNFLAGNIGMPTYAGEMTVKELGMDVDVFTAEGKKAAPGESGELVCKRPFPNMPVAFWNDPCRRKYREAYFSTIPGVWRHGDFVKQNPKTKGWIILGRSDGVLNPSGIRYGSGEIYSILDHHFADRVADSICVGQQRPGDENERVFLFLELTKNTDWERLESDIRAQIAKDLSRRHVPQFIFPTDQIPFNGNHKKLEIPLKKVLSGGEAVLAGLSVQATERAALAKYVPYYRVEKLLASRALVKAKL
jgi:acetoacetyl-CoA synthetase